MAKTFKLNSLMNQTFKDVLVECKANNIVVKRYPKDTSKALKSFIVLDDFINVPKEFQYKDKKVDYKSLAIYVLAQTDAGNYKLQSTDDSVADGILSML